MREVNNKGFVTDRSIVDNTEALTPVLSASVTGAKVDSLGRPYVEQNINGINGRIPVVIVDGAGGGGSGTTPTLQQVTDQGSSTTNTIQVPNAINSADAVNKGQLDTGLATKANVVHTHEIADVNNLSSTLANKANLIHAHEIADVNNLATTLAGKANLVHNHEIADINNLTSTLAAKADLIGGKIDINQVPDTLLGAVRYKGLWNATTNTPALSNGDTTKDGEYYIVSTAGTQFTTDFELGDWVINTKGTWQKVDNTDAVKTVNGQKGVVVLTAADVGAATVTALNNEITARQNGDATLQTAINNEITARQNADITLQTNISNVEGGYINLVKDSTNLGAIWLKQNTWALDPLFTPRLHNYSVAGCNVTGLTGTQFYSLTSPNVTCKEGDVFTGSFYVYIPSGNGIDQNAAMDLSFFNSANSRINFIVVNLDLTKLDQWQRVSATGTAPANTSYCNIKIYPRQNGKFWVTTPMLTYSNKLYNYIPSDLDITSAAVSTFQASSQGIHFKKTFGTAVSIANNTSFNITGSVNSLDIYKRWGYEVTDFIFNPDSITLPKKAGLSKYLITIRLTGTISGASGTAREFSVQVLEKGNANVLGAQSIIKISDNSLNNRQAIIQTYSDGINDGYSDPLKGLQVLINNTSTQTITLTALELLIF